MRDATDQVVTKEQFQHFLNTHRNVKCLVPESNDAMRNSYLILDEYMRFLYTCYFWNICFTSFLSCTSHLQNITLRQTEIMLGYFKFSECTISFYIARFLFICFKSSNLYYTISDSWTTQRVGRIQLNLSWTSE